MQPFITTTEEKKLIGVQMMMSFNANKTHLLWQSFMPMKKEILNTVSSNFFSLQVYPQNINFNSVDANTMFEKWAAVEVLNHNNVPASMKAFILKSGLYAVFYYKGLSSDTSIFKYIFSKWLPSSKYNLDSRPHFEILGNKYKNNSSDSEEEIWIPIKPKV